jgi:hypothetical protein
VNLHRHLAQLHPSKYGALLDGVQTVGILDVRELTDEHVALRLLVLTDPMCDRDLPLLAGGVRLNRMLSPEILKAAVEEIPAHPVPLDRGRERGLKAGPLIHPSTFSVGANPAGLSYSFQTCGDGGTIPWFDGAPGEGVTDGSYGNTLGYRSACFSSRRLGVCAGICRVGVCAISVCVFSVCASREDGSRGR